MKLANTSRLLKKSASIVLASLRGSPYGTRVRFASSLAAALLDSLFEQPGGFAGAVHDFLQPYVSSCQSGFSIPC